MSLQAVLEREGKFDLIFLDLDDRHRPPPPPPLLLLLVILMMYSSSPPHPPTHPMPQAVLEKEGKFDVIFMDLDDPLEGGPCYQLYTSEFYTMMKQHLNPGGIFVTQVSHGLNSSSYQLIAY
jgi:spermidine synthase